jgi:hypothetical protein
MVFADEVKAKVLSESVVVSVVVGRSAGRCAGFSLTLRT